MKARVAGSDEMIRSAPSLHLIARRALLFCGILSSLLYVVTTLIGGLAWEGYSLAAGVLGFMEAARIATGLPTPWLGVIERLNT